MSVEKYLDLSTKYLEQARETIGKGDCAKAGEMLWGATAEMVKALAFHRGVELKSHERSGNTSQNSVRRQGTGKSLNYSM